MFTLREWKCMGDNNPIGLDARRPRSNLAPFKQPLYEIDVGLAPGCLKMVVHVFFKTHKRGWRTGQL